MVSKVILIVCWAQLFVGVMGEREVLVVSGGPDDNNLGVIEIYDFLSRTWRLGFLNLNVWWFFL